LENALAYIGACEDFDLILAGEDVVEGKPSPEIYRTVLDRMGVAPYEAIVFEDSAVGMASAEAAGISYIEIKDSFYGDRG
jgi:HAD superfamily hydrolase (TIGR01509 family)